MVDGWWIEADIVALQIVCFCVNGCLICHNQHCQQQFIVEATQYNRSYLSVKSYISNYSTFTVITTFDVQVTTRLPLKIKDPKGSLTNCESFQSTKISAPRNHQNFNRVENDWGCAKYSLVLVSLSPVPQLSQSVACRFFCRPCFLISCGSFSLGLAGLVGGAQNGAPADVVGGWLGPKIKLFPSSSSSSRQLKVA